MLIERTVKQCTPQKYEGPVPYDKLEKMLSKADKTWADVEMVYQLCERRATRKRNTEVTIDIMGLYLQGKHGQMDYKYLEGLDFLIPVRSVHKEIMEFFEGSWKNEHGC